MRFKAAELVLEARPGRGVHEPARSRVLVKDERLLRIAGRGDDVDEAIAVEVLCDHAAGEVEGVDAELWRYVGESADVLRGVEDARRDEILGGQAAGVLPERHRHDVQE